LIALLALATLSNGAPAEESPRKPSFEPPPPPPHEKVAEMARYLVHYNDWLSMSTISTMSGLEGRPFANVFSFSDGPIEQSSGIPYFYLTELDMSVKDLLVNPQASLTMTLAQGEYCNANGWDPEDPRCAHVIISGEIVKVDDPLEREFAQEALFSRHPAMETWPQDHGWFFYKMDVSKIILLDWFGGAYDINLTEYYSVNMI